MASTGLSLIYRRTGPALSEKFQGLVFGHPVTIMIFSLLPVLISAPLYRLSLFESGMMIERYFFTGFAVLAVALILIAFYVRKGSLTGGIAGFFLLLLYLFMLSVILSLLIFPEKWPFMKGAFPFPLFSTAPLYIFLIFVSLSLINSGASFRFKYLRWAEMELPANSELRRPVDGMGRFLSAAGTALLPPLLFLLLFTLPPYSFSREIFPVSASLLLLMVLSIYFLIPEERKNAISGKRGLTVSFVLSLLITLSFSTVIYLFHHHANIDRIDMAEISAAKRNDSIEAGRLELYSKNMQVSSEFGEKIFRERCTACHAFDRTILGPSFNSVIPKYRENPDNMVNFILNPVKVNPALPPMPDPGLSSWEAKSVVQYIFGNDKKTNGEKGE